MLLFMIAFLGLFMFVSFCSVFLKEFRKAEADAKAAREELERQGAEARVRAMRQEAREAGWLR